MKKMQFFLIRREKNIIYRNKVKTERDRNKFAKGLVSSEKLGKKYTHVICISNWSIFNYVAYYHLRISYFQNVRANDTDISMCWKDAELYVCFEANAPGGFSMYTIHVIYKRYIFKKF